MQSAHEVSAASDDREERAYSVQRFCTARLTIHNEEISTDRISRSHQRRASRIADHRERNRLRRGADLLAQSARLDGQAADARIESSLFKATRKLTKLSPVLIHANYLINLSAADDVILLKSIASFREEVQRGIALGADYLVVHPGSARGSCEADGIAATAHQFEDCLQRIAIRKAAHPSGEHCRTGPMHRSPVRASARDHGRLSEAAAWRLHRHRAFIHGWLRHSRRGWAGSNDRNHSPHGRSANVRAVHFNDSRAPFNSRVDRHWHIGEGHIGRDALRRFAQHPKLAHCAFILETPYDDPRADLKNLEALRSFVS